MIDGNSSPNNLPANPAPSLVGRLQNFRFAIRNKGKDTMSASLQALRGYLREQPSGPISASGELSTLLAKAWDSLTGSDDGGMQAYKLHGRIESAEWNPPCLDFTIERHGATALGSTRAELQTWSVDVVQGTAVRGHPGIRQVHKAQPRLDVAPRVEDVAAAIQSGADHLALKWSADRKTVRVRIGEVIPDVGASQTTTNRRKRFRAQLDARLKAAGWEILGPNNYRRG